VSGELHRCVERIRGRQQVRAWEYRQRRHSMGLWFRLRRLLVDAERAYEIPEAAARELLEQGLRPEPLGDELQPQRLFLFVPPERVDAIPGAREIPVRLGPELLGARCLALVPWRGR
jgi:hypothetical protein